MRKRIWVIVLAVVTIFIMALSLTDIIEKSLGMCIALGLVVIFNAVIAIYGYKSDVKLITCIMGTLSVIGVILLIYNIVGYNKIHMSNEYAFQITLKQSAGAKKLLFSHNGNNYYTYNVADINVIMNEDEAVYSLETALNDGHVTLEQIKELAVPNSNTIGYEIYYDGGQEKYQNDEYSFVICENKKDVVFSTFNYVYSDEICK